MFGAASDTVGTGLVESLARLGGNITGLSNQIIDISGKKLEFLREIAPAIYNMVVPAAVGGSCPANGGPDCSTEGQSAPPDSW